MKVIKSGIIRNVPDKKVGTYLKNGYKEYVSPVKKAETDLLDGMNVKELKTYAAKYNIDIGKAAKAKDIRAIIATAILGDNGTNVSDPIGGSQGTGDQEPDEAKDDGGTDPPGNSDI